jgi:hypothetical protein
MYQYSDFLQLGGMVLLKKRQRKERQKKRPLYQIQGLTTNW